MFAKKRNSVSTEQKIYINLKNVTKSWEPLRKFLYLSGKGEKIDNELYCALKKCDK